MITGGNNKLANVPTVTGLSNVDADVVTSSSVDTETLTLNGVDVGAQIAQIPINTAAIAGLQQVTTGQSYVSVGDTTTFSNNVTLTTGKTMTADNFVGLASNASQVTVVTNNTSSTYYPVFAGGTGSGQKQLQFDPNTTPLSYTPDSSILRMGSIETTNNSNVNNLFMGSKNTATTFMTYGPGLPALTTGDYNVIMGGNIGTNLQGGSNNFALGYNAFNNNVNGCNNCIMGHRAALGLGTSGNFYTWYNTVIGDTALTNADDVQEITCIGWGTGPSILNGNLKCTCIGATADCADGLSFATSIGAGVTVTTSDTVKIGRAADTVIFDGTITNTITQPAAGDSSTKVPTTAWVQTAITAGAGAPATTIALTSDNTAGTYFLPFSKTTSPTSNALYIDDATTPLTYNPNTSTLTASTYGLRTTVASSITTSGTTISLLNNNIGGTYDFTVATAGVPLTILSLNETNSFYRVPFVVSTQIGSTSASAFSVRNSSTNIGIEMISDSTAGSKNPLILASDSAIYGNASAINTSDLVLTTWSSTTTGVRITPTTAVIGAGGAGANPTASTTYSGSTVTIAGDPVVTNRNILVNNGSGFPLTIGNGASTATNNVIITSFSLASTRNFTTGGNVVIGELAGNGLIIASSNNTVIGDESGATVSGNRNIIIGHQADVPVAGNSRQIAIGTDLETMFIQGGFNWRVGQITTTTNGTLNAANFVLCQLYMVAMTAVGQTITLPNPATAAYIGARVIFKRKTNTTQFTLTQAAGFLNYGAITIAASPYTVPNTIFQVDIVSDGTNWCVVSQR